MRGGMVEVVLVMVAWSHYEDRYGHYRSRWCGVHVGSWVSIMVGFGLSLSTLGVHYGRFMVSIRHLNGLLLSEGHGGTFGAVI